jgi:5-hydroxyisourate hydrolase
MGAGSSMGGLTTHVLDTATGRPAASMRIDAFAISGDQRTSLTTCYTNADGRPNAPVIEAANFRRGRYELHFHVGAYLIASGAALPDPPFLDVVPIAFGVASDGEHYHVPLLVSPFGYATYRGS